MLVEFIVLFITFGTFLATVSCALMAGQARNRRQIRRVRAKVDRLAYDRLTDDEREAEEARRAAIEAKNRRIMADYEYGGC